MQKILIMFMIFSFNFQNIPLKSTIGTIGAAGINYFIIFSLINGIVNCVTNKYKLKYTKLDKKMIGYIGYMIIITFFSYFYCFYFFNQTHIFEENILLKGIKIVIYNVVGFSIISYMSTVLSSMTEREIKNILNLNFIFVSFIFFIQIFQMKRVDLLASEPSEAGYITTLFFLLTLYYNKKTKEKTIVPLIILLYIIQIFKIQSKGSILVLLIGIIFYLFVLYGGKKSLKSFLGRIMMISFTLLIYQVFFSEKLYKLFINDLEKFTSTITRSWSILTSIKIFLSNLFGTGGAYLLFFQKYGLEVRDLLEKHFQMLNYSEINFMIESGQSLSPKSGFFMELILFGVGAIYFYSSIFNYFFKNLRAEKLLILLLVVTYLSMIFYIDKYMTPTYILVFSILQSEILKRSKNGCIYNNG